MNILEYYSTIANSNIMTEIANNINKGIMMYEYGDPSGLLQLYDIYCEATDRSKKAEIIENWMKANNYGDPHGKNPSKAKKAMRMRNFLIQHDFDPETETIAIPGIKPNDPPRRIKFMIDKFIGIDDDDSTKNIVKRNSGVTPGYVPEAIADVELSEQIPNISMSDYEGSLARREDYLRRKKAGKLKSTKHAINMPEYIQMPSKILKDKQAVAQMTTGHETGHADSHAKSKTYNKKKSLKIDSDHNLLKDTINNAFTYSIDPDAFSKETFDPDDPANEFIKKNAHRLDMHDRHPEEIHADEFGLANGRMRTKHAGKKNAKKTRKMTPDEAQRGLTLGIQKLAGGVSDSTKARAEYLGNKIKEFFTFLDNDMVWMEYEDVI